MKTALEIRVGNVLNLEGKPCKVITQEVKGTGKFGKTVHLKVKSLEDAHTLEKSIRAEDRVEELEVHRVKMQYSYKDGDQFVFMNMESYEQFSLSSKVVGKQEVFLKENMEIDVEFIGGKPMSIAFPKIVELAVISAPPAGSDGTFKEVELENGLKVLVPQFVKEGEKIRLDVETLSYLERVTVKSMGVSAPRETPKQPQ